jgi:hypothetical protein
LVVPLYAIDFTELAPVKLLVDTTIGVPEDVPGVVSSIDVIPTAGMPSSFDLSEAVITPAAEEVAAYIVPFVPSDELTTTVVAF